MTALAGIWDRGGGDPAGAAARMLKAQAAYGQKPASWSSGEVALSRTLFPTLPEDAFDRGPVHSRCGRFTLVADLRLDDRPGLLRDLGLSPADGARLSDAALLMAGLERWDEAVLERLVGDFALALWDAAEERLLLARDFLGRRPLHYHEGDGFFAFASMPKGLHALGDVPYAVSEERALDFLALVHSHGPASFYEGIQRVEPGQALTVTRGGIEARRIWTPDLTPLRLPSHADYVEAARETFDQAVASRLRGAGGRVGAHLSAGLDSSAVAATAARLTAAEGGRVTAFTAVPRAGWTGPLPRLRFADEGPLAASVAALYPNMEHILVAANRASPLDGLDRQFLLYDRPLLNLCSAVWMDAIHDEARARGLGVLLTGEVGNITISYDGRNLLAELVAGGRLLEAGRQAAALVRRGQPARAVAMAALSALLPDAAMARLARWRETPSHAEAVALHPSQAGDGALARRAAERGAEPHQRVASDGLAVRLQRLVTFDSGAINKGVLAGWGLDLRDPTADRRLVEFCLRVPTAQFSRGGVERALARDAFADRLPAALLAAPLRGYQFADWAESLAPARDEAAAMVRRFAALPFLRSALDLPKLEALVRDWPDDPQALAGRRIAYRSALLRALSLGRFVEKISGSNAS